MSQSAGFEAFRPSFSSLGWCPLRVVAEEAFAAAARELRARLGHSEQRSDQVVEGVARPLRGVSAIQVGHPAAVESPDGGALSGVVPWRFEVTFDGHGGIIEAKLAVHLLNPRFMLSRRGFVPASFDASTRSFRPTVDGARSWGMRVKSDPNASLADHFNMLAEGLPQLAFAREEIPQEFLPFDQETLDARLDLTLLWKPAEAKRDGFGYMIGHPRVGWPAGASLHTLELFSPDADVGDGFDALVHVSRRFALHLPEEHRRSVTLVGGDAGGREHDERLEHLRRTFGLRSDFVGVVFPGMSAHWLDGSLTGHSRVRLEVGASAIALAGSPHDVEASTSRWCSSATLAVEGRFAGVFDSARLHVSIADDVVRNVSLSGTFGANGLEGILPGFAGSQAVLSLKRSGGVTEAPEESADSPAEWEIELGVVGERDRPLARVGRDDLPDALTPLATALVFGRLRPAASHDQSLEAGGKAGERDGFVRLGSGGDLAKLLAVSTLSRAFRDAVEATELRVVAAYVRAQRRGAAEDGAGSPDTDIALLFDIDVDYDINFQRLGIRTARSLSAFVEGVGFSNDGALFHRVQALRGLFELGLGDPGLWRLGDLGKLLKVSSLNVRLRHGVPELVIQFQLRGNLGIVRADDFTFVLNLRDESGRFAVFPSSIQLDVPKALEARGQLAIEDDENGRKAIRGSLDLSILAAGGLRLFGGVRLERVVTADSSQTALVATASVEFPRPIPLGGSGLSIDALSGLFAQHFVRVEQASASARSPALQWLQQAEGDVVRSVEIPDLWRPEIDRWSFGLGATLSLAFARTLVNLNSMLVVEVPGPRIVLFSRVNLLRYPRSNTAAAKGNELVGGIIGVLDVDPVKRSISLEALAEVDVRNLVTIHAPLGLRLRTNRPSDWTFHLGTVLNPATARLSLGNIVDVQADAYLMAAGAGLDLSPPLGRLEGLALATGFATRVEIGRYGVSLRAVLECALEVSLSPDLYLRGSLAVAGRLVLWGPSLGAFVAGELQYVRRGGSSHLYLKVTVGGSLRIGLLRISGSLTVRLGNPARPAPTLPPLVSEVALVASTDVGLEPGTIVGPIDASLGTARQHGDPIEDTATYPLDAIIAISMVMRPGKIFDLGGYRGGYHLDHVRLTSAGGDVVPLATVPQRWWQEPSTSNGEQPGPAQLSLFTRNPFGIANVLPESKALDALIEEALEDVCASVPRPRDHLFAFAHAHVGTEGPWHLDGIPCSRDSATRHGGTRPSRLRAEPQGPARRTPRCTYVGGGGARVPVAAVALDNAALEDAAWDDPWPGLRFEHEGIAPGSTIQILLMVASTSDAFLEHVDDAWQFTATTATTEEVLQGHWHDEGVYHDCQSGAASVAAFNELSTSERPSGVRLLQVTVPLPSGGRDDAVKAFTASFDPELASSVLEPHDRVLVHVFAVRLRPMAETERFAEGMRARDERVRELGEYLGDDPADDVLLLDPDTSYSLSVGYTGLPGELGDEVAELGSEEQVFTFTTSAHPPPHLAPYVLTSYPQDGERHHVFGEAPGIALRSTDILRILAKYGARLEVTITDDGGHRVTDTSKALDWTAGVVFDPETLLDASDPPAGIERLASFAQTPSPALAAARARAIALDCVEVSSSLPQRALWIGFDVALAPLSAYSIRIALVDANGEPWSFPNGRDGQGEDESTVYRWRFATSAFSGTKAHARAIAVAPTAHRLLEQPLVIPDAAHHDHLTVLTDKRLEDIVANAAGGRLAPMAEPRVTVLWTTTDEQVRPHAVLITSPEPLVKRMRFPLLGAAPGTDGEAGGTSLQVATRILSAPVVASGGSGARTYVSTGGFAALIDLAEVSLDADVTLALRDESILEVHRTLAEPAPEIFTLTATQLRGRQRPPEAARANGGPHAT